jgi:hypothetical protein
MFEKIKIFFQPKIEVIVRHCHFSDISAHKNRFPGFSRKKCHDNLVATLDPKRVNVTFLLDTYHPSTTPHFVLQQTRYPVIEIKEGTETGSFLKLLSYVESLDLSPQTIVYFLEDDYLHQEGWVDVLIEGCSIPEAHYVTLFDHRDKYFHPNYTSLKSKIFHTEHCHWRTTPSTTNTYAMRYETLKEDISIHRQFSEGRKISADHEKFLELGKQGRNLISSIPGWSTHVETDYSSPCVNWRTFW